MLLLLLFCLFSYNLASVDAKKAHDDLPGKYLWVHYFSSMGFGNKMQWVERMMEAAKVSGRTYVFPPLFYAENDFSSFADMDVESMRKQFAGNDEGIIKHMRELSGGWSNVKRKEKWFPASEWFDFEAINEYTPVMEYDDFIKKLHGRPLSAILVDSCYVLGGSKSYNELCAVNDEITRKRRDQKYRIKAYAKTPEVEAEKALCKFDLPFPNEDKWTGDPKVILNAPAIRDLPLLGLEGICLESVVELFDRRIEERLRPIFKWSKRLERLADEFFAEPNHQRILAVHWRRGDLDLDHPHMSLMERTPQKMADLVNKLIDKNQPICQDGVCEGGLQAVYLCTDLFFKQDLRRFKKYVKLPVVRYRDFRPETNATDNAAMDLLIAGRAELFLGAPSSFTRWIDLERHHNNRKTIYSSDLTAK